MDAPLDFVAEKQFMHPFIGAMNPHLSIENILPLKEDNGPVRGHEGNVSVAPSRDREGAVEAISRENPSLTVRARISVIFIGAAHAALRGGTTKHENE